VTRPVTGLVEELLRELAPRVLGVLVRRHGAFDTCEDAVQEALLAAATTWPTGGLPTNPTGWLITTASRRLIETWRSESARRRREASDVRREPPPADPAPATDDTLALLVLCCHPALTPPSQVALTLRAVGGLSTAEIARALLIPEATVAQRISRAKARIKATGAQFREPTPTERAARIPSVLHVLYLIFNEGYTASSGSELYRVELTAEAIRLTRALHARLPSDGEVAGLPYQVQAGIAAVHDEATRAEDTDWRQILGLYELLACLAPGPMVTLNRIVAVGMVRGPAVALEQLDAAETNPALAGHYRVDAVRAHLLDETGQHDAAREHYRRAARHTLSLPSSATSSPAPPHHADHRDDGGWPHTARGGEHGCE
jgi:RNA polymerase sigma factor (sigma-70 family)